MNETYFDQQENGGKFYRADLHIHSYGFDDGSFDVKDSTMTPENIVDKAIESGLSIISIADHNEINNSKRAIDYSKDKDILVIPGIEVSTIQGHLLCYFPKFEDLRKFHGKLTIAENKETCNQGIAECLTLAQDYGGIGVLAHIELESSGFEKAIGKFGPVMDNILNHPNLYGFEIVKIESESLYTDEDLNVDRKNLIINRRTQLDFDSDYNLAKIMSSDSHSLDKLGTNADGEKRLTRIKMDSLTFEGFKNALMSPDSRVRLENVIPLAIPHFIGIVLEDGLLANQEVKFSKNLTCIIGGRGTGKSTLLNSIIEGSGNVSNSGVVDSDVWSQTLHLIFEDETGKRTRFVREKNAEVINITDGAEGINTVPLEIWGQGAAAETIQHSDERPEVLLKILDDFIDLEHIKKEEEGIRIKIIENRSKIEESELKVKQLPHYDKLIKEKSEKIERLKKDKVGDLVKYHDALNKEKEFRESLIEDIKDLKETYKDILNDSDVFDAVTNLEDKNIEIGKDEFIEVKKLVEKIAKFIDGKSKELNAELESTLDKLRVQIRSWQAKELKIQKDIDKRKSELKAQGIPFDLGEINQISKDLILYQKEQKILLKEKESLKKIQKEHMNLVKQRFEIKSKIFMLRQDLAKKLNKNLKNTIEDFEVHVNFKEGRLSPEFVQHLKNTMDYRTVNVGKAEIISKIYNPKEFIDGIIKNDLGLLLKYKEGERAIFSKSDTEALINTYTLNNKYKELESILHDDLPSIEVIKHITNNGKPKIIRKSLAKLSLGQQQSILLAILLHSKNKYPLLIDQPEDNLDSEFISKTIVSNLKKIKEKRQVIVVTHNANIAVLADAELIIPLKSTNEKSMIVDRGSIDKESIRKKCCDILEGGERAFRKRRDLYNLNK